MKKLAIITILAAWFGIIIFASFSVFSAFKAAGATDPSSFGISAQQVFELEAYEVTWFVRGGTSCYIVRSKARNLSGAGIALDCKWRR